MQTKLSLVQRAYRVVATLVVLACVDSIGVVNAQASEQQDDSELEVIIVSATRRDAALSDVPVSISVFTTDEMNNRGIATIEDLFRLTPGVNFKRDQTFGRGRINIRGIESNQGFATTAIYIDDTPISVRATGINLAQNYYPELVDLARVEVLRGPQGTLFGAGAAGGAVRFITRDPVFETLRGYAKSEIGFIEDGGTTYELAGSINVPISDQLAWTGSASYRRDGGWIDRASGSSLNSEIDANWREAETARLALKYAVNDSLTLIPSIYFQSVYKNHNDSYWPEISDPSNGEFINASRVSTRYDSKFNLYTLKASLDIGPITVLSNTSYFDGNDSLSTDYSDFVPVLLGLTATADGSRVRLTQTSDPVLPATGPEVLNDYINPQRGANHSTVFTQEFRVQSATGDDRLSWIAGIFYSEYEQIADFLDDSDPLSDGQWDELLAVAPPATRAFFEPFPLSRNRYSYDGQVRTTDEQLAIFGDVTFKVLPALSLNVGLRYEITNDFEYSEIATGPFAGGGQIGGGKQSENPLTPKFALSYELDDRNMAYISASKGYRSGGANVALPNACEPEAEELGLVVEDYDSDSVWSYEIGFKNRLFNDKLQMNSSIFKIDWSEIQQSVRLACGFGLTQNVGDATSEGFDIQAAFSVTDNFSLNTNIGYIDAKYTTSVIAPNGAAIAREGIALAATPWLVTAGAEYQFNLIGLPALVRVDYQYSSRDPITSNLDPESSSFNSRAIRLDSYEVLDVRASITLDNWDISAFVMNVTNEAPIRAHGAFGSRNFVLRDTTIRPRTIGLQAVFRY